MIEIVLSCDGDGCEHRLSLRWGAGEYVSLIGPEVYEAAHGHLTLDGSCPVEVEGWRVEGGSRLGHPTVVLCPAHAGSSGA